MTWTSRILAAANALLVALAFLYKSPGEDPAGEGMRLGFALFYAIALAVVLLLYRYAKARGVRIVLLGLLTLPVIAILYTLLLSLGI